MSRSAQLINRLLIEILCAVGNGHDRINVEILCAVKNGYDRLPVEILCAVRVERNFCHVGIERNS